MQGVARYTDLEGTVMMEGTRLYSGQRCTCLLTGLQRETDDFGLQLQDIQSSATYPLFPLGPRQGAASGKGGHSRDVAFTLPGETGTNTD